MKKNGIAGTDILIELLDQAFEKAAWHGPNLRGSVRGLKLDELLWKPAPKRHCVWDIILHTAYWKYIVYRKLTGAERGSFPRKPSNWPSLPDRPDKKSWDDDLSLLRAQHALLRNAVSDFPQSKLNQSAPKSKYRYVQFIYGAASHDLYHAGQIQLLKRLRKG